MRVGIGYDIHRLETGRRLVLGGVELAHPAGLVGHSDADVVLHAVADALLGAAGLPDIGELFPDTDPAYQGADSRRLLTEVLAQVHVRGLAVNNLDVIVHAEVPKLGPYKRQIAESVAKLAGVPRDVLERANAVLNELEKTFNRESNRPVLAAVQRRRQRQLRLFEEPEEIVVRQLRDLNLADLDTDQAADVLAKWRRMLGFDDSPKSDP